jgi:hypothetical protein
MDLCYDVLYIIWKSFFSNMCMNELTNIAYVTDSNNYHLPVAVKWNWLNRTDHGYEQTYSINY